MNSPAPIRVLVVEDSSTVRKVVTDALNSDKEITVVATAANGRLGLEELLKVEPDLITLDIEMPEMDGLTMLSELRRTHPRLPVIMVSTLTGRGAAATLDALSRGASDYVTKPSSATNTSATSAIDHFRRELIPRVKALCPRRSASTAPQRVALRPISAPTVVRSRVTPPTGPSAQTRPAAGPGARPLAAAARSGRFDVLAIGCSTGGPNALELVLAELPADLGVPVLVTQHMPPMFTKMLADRLDQKCAVRVVEAENGMELTAGTVYLAPGDYHMVCRRSPGGFTIETNQAPPENSCRPAVDVMFRSVAENFGSKTFAVVMTGMGYDGRVGSQAIVAAGGEVAAQDQETSVVWGMPGAVVEAGLAAEILPLHQIGSAIDRRFPRRAGPIGLTPRPSLSVSSSSVSSSSVSKSSGSGSPSGATQQPALPARPAAQRPTSPAQPSVAARPSTAPAVVPAAAASTRPAPSVPVRRSGIPSRPSAVPPRSVPGRPGALTPRPAGIDRTAARATTSGSSRSAVPPTDRLDRGPTDHAPARTPGAQASNPQGAIR